MTLQTRAIPRRCGWHLDCYGLSAVSEIEAFNMSPRLFALVIFLIGSPAALAQEGGELHLSLDTVWLVTAGALVFFMQAGFALLESGMARSKNAVNVIMKNYTDVCFGSLAFWLVGYGLMFGTNPTGWFGTDHFLLGDAEHMDYSQLFFQAMFAATAATIASGAMAERTHYWGYIVGSTITTGIIYAVFGSWAWGSLYGGQGWLKELGFVDFAGSSVVHSVGAWCALAGIMVIGPRLGRFGPGGEPRPIPGHNLTSVALGGFILWLGWFGFNGGSTGHAETRIGAIVLNTHLGAASGAVGAVLMLLLQRRPVLLTMTVNGSLGGLVSVTAGCATLSPTFAVVTGAIAGGLVVVGSEVMERLRLDDVVGAVPVHGVCGAWGTLAAGLFYRGDMFNLGRISVQMIGIAAAFLWAFVAAFVMYTVIDLIMGLRADTVCEQRGLDYTEHSEVGYPEFQGELLHEEIR
jgi:Amt family ammonium transporter